jgi:hypothetical protein
MTLAASPACMAAHGELEALAAFGAVIALRLQR